MSKAALDALCAACAGEEPRAEGLRLALKGVHDRAPARAELLVPGRARETAEEEVTRQTGEARRHCEGWAGKQRTPPPAPPARSSAPARAAAGSPSWRARR